MYVKVTQLLPHRDPFILISEVIDSDEEQTITQFKIDEHHVLVEGGYLTEAGIIENMAQTAAAGLAYQSHAHVDDSKEPSIGYIGQIKNYKLHQLPKIGEVIETKTIVTHQIMNAHIVQAKVFLNDELIADAEVRVFVQA